MKPAPRRATASAYLHGFSWLTGSATGGRYDHEMPRRPRRELPDTPFRVVKRQFGYQKVRFKGQAKNTAQILTLFALSNLWMMRRTLLKLAGDVRP